MTHLDDLLSGYVDGELSAEERSVVDAHLAECPSCRDELAATQLAKAWVTGLPVTEPPFGFYERMLRGGASAPAGRQRWPVRLGAVSLAATASVWFGVIGFASLDAGRPGGMPALASLFKLHASAAPAPRTRTSPPVVADPSTIHKAESLGLPDELPGGYRLAAVLDRGESEQARYQNGASLMSVFLTPGAIDIGRLPGGTTIDWVDGQMVFVVPWKGDLVVMAQRGDAVVTIMGPEPLAPSMAEQVDPPTPGRSIADRVQNAGKGLLQAFGIG